MKESNKGGIGFLGILTLIFITLKLCNVITWSWWWVLSPLWIPFAIFLFISLIGLVLYFVGKIYDKKHT